MSYYYVVKFSMKTLIDLSSICDLSVVITLSSGGKTLRAWNLADGQMVWESVLSGSIPSRSLLSIPVSELHSLHNFC